MASDFLDTFMNYTEHVPSPDIFRVWAGISCVAGALERRVWARVYPTPTFANLFVSLVATPGIGKGVIDVVAKLWRHTRDERKRPMFHVMPDSVNAASMLLAFKDAKKTMVRDGKLLHEYHSLLVPNEEMGVLMPAHDMELLGRLNYIFTNPEFIRVLRVYQKEVLEIIHPQLNILTGAQPGFLASMLPEEAWSMGFTSRLIMVYAGLGKEVKLFAEQTGVREAEQSLLAMLGELGQLEGQFKWEPKAAEALVNWNSSGRLPVPEHSRLTHYNNRRLQFVIKLSMIAAVSRERDLVIRHEDVTRAFDWLFPTEAVMPDIFREMVHKSDNQTLLELHFFMWKEWMRTGKKPLHESRLWLFMQARVPSDKIPRILDALLRSGMATRAEGTQLYTPRPAAAFALTAPFEA